ncbi:50S ribosomal protein L22 [Candidatus Bipolaricaulota bacterium]|nr:50S ribosomal protein L22 [Candidatus Bipolaricaulota bacterium]MBS3813810.1 50S ribosomal protein L22 [Candidatus Bipolaricaulota bacterium]MBS3824929.1 50S ribosomal protein L22 [Candidatus Bipolaricaulota bacterium]
MKESKAITKNVRVSPKKARLVADAIRGQSVDEALKTVKFSKKKAARYLKDTLESAIANAQHNHDMAVDKLKVKEAAIDEGQTIKRMKPRAQGRADIMKRRQSHIKVILVEEE